MPGSPMAVLVTIARTHHEQALRQPEIKPVADVPISGIGAVTSRNGFRLACATRKKVSSF